jgi:hypothetical protein
MPSMPKLPLNKARPLQGVFVTIASAFAGLPWSDLALTARPEWSWKTATSSKLVCAAIIMERVCAHVVLHHAATFLVPC